MNEISYIEYLLDILELTFCVDYGIVFPEKGTDFLFISDILLLVSGTLVSVPFFVHFLNYYFLFNSTVMKLNIIISARYTI